MFQLIGQILIIKAAVQPIQLNMPSIAQVTPWNNIVNPVADTQDMYFPGSLTYNDNIYGKKLNKFNRRGSYSRSGSKIVSNEGKTFENEFIDGGYIKSEDLINALVSDDKKRHIEIMYELLEMKERNKHDINKKNDTDVDINRDSTINLYSTEKDLVFK